MPIITSLGDKVRFLRTARKLTQAELAAATGITQQSIDAIENGKTERPRKIVELARALKVNAEALQNPQATINTDTFTLAHEPKEPLFPPLPSEPEFQPAPGAPDVPTLRALPQDIPVLGTAEGGAAGDFLMNGQTIDYLRRPPGLARTKDVFALYVTGNSMWPRFNEGEPVYVTTSRPPAIGDDVIVELHPASEGGDVVGFIKRLVKRTPTKIIVEQFTPAQELEFERERVRSLYRVIPWAELLGL